MKHLESGVKLEQEERELVYDEVNKDGEYLSDNVLGLVSSVMYIDAKIDEINPNPLPEPDRSEVWQAVAINKEVLRSLMHDLAISPHLNNAGNVITDEFIQYSSKS